MESKNLVVIYHGSCPDGTTGGYYFSKMYPECQLIPGYYSYPMIIPDITGKDVIFVDFTFHNQIMLDIKSKAKSLFVLDHHIGAKENLIDIPCLFDVERCGAQLAWDYLYNKSQPSKNRPSFVDYIGARDTWSFDKLPNSYEISKGIYSSYDLTLLSEIEKLDQISSSSYVQVWEEKMFQLGSTLLKQERSLFDSMFKNTTLCQMKDGKDTEKSYIVYLSECPFIYRSDFGNYLALKSECHFAVCYSYDIKRDAYIISLRGVKEKGFDLSEISKGYQGGGHYCASGMRLNGIDSLRQVFTVIG